MARLINKTRYELCAGLGEIREGLEILFVESLILVA